MRKEEKAVAAGVAGSTHTGVFFLVFRLVKNRIYGVLHHNFFIRLPLLHLFADGENHLCPLLAAQEGHFLHLLKELQVPLGVDTPAVRLKWYYFITVQRRRISAKKRSILEWYNKFTSDANKT